VDTENGGPGIEGAGVSFVSETRVGGVPGKLGIGGQPRLFDRENGIFNRAL
jgi:hypothetical protein